MSEVASAPFRHARSVEIAAPVEDVWAYAGDSHHASEWSVYFDHIAPLPESPVPDGRVGALRRCYRRADETGPRWDEEVVALVPQRYREIRTYALRGFRPAVQWALSPTQFRVGQHYEALDADRTRLTFSTALLRPAIPGARAQFGRFAGDVERIFQVNLGNIRAAVEARHDGVPYVRPHPYAPDHRWD